uniref:Uncharacterized protein n=1 Tax=Lepeophtheirus salmonis TaxID=72036 RepID=A0A0K2US62_LEPSM
MIVTVKNFQGHSFFEQPYIGHNTEICGHKFDYFIENVNSRGCKRVVCHDPFVRKSNIVIQSRGNGGLIHAGSSIRERNNFTLCVRSNFENGENVLK